MKRVSCAVAFLAAMFLPFVPGPASGQEATPPGGGPGPAGKAPAGAPGEPGISLRVPLFSPAFAAVPIAEVNGEPITVQAFTNVITSFHGRQTSAKEAARIEYGQVLERLVNVKLVSQEAEKIGLDELPEVTDQVKAFAAATRRQLLIQNHMRKTEVRPREEDTERIYRESVREYRIRSVLFARQEDARKMEEEIRGGKGFEEVAERLIDEGIAQGTREPDSVRLGAGKLQPQVAKVVAETAVGSVSPLIRVKDGFVILKVEEVRYADDPAERDKAEKAATSLARNKALDEYKSGLVKKYAKRDEKRIAATDFDAKKPGIANLLKDKRAVVRIQGESAVTVADWTQAMQAKFYHGITLGDQARKVNKKKVEVLDELVMKRVLDREAAAQGIEQTDEFKSMIGEFRDSLVFGMFLEKVVTPDIKVSPEEIDEYYRRHSAEYRYPEMMRIDGIAFGQLRDAEDALGKVQKGSDIKWVRENAEGQVPAGAPGRLEFRGDLVTTGSLPEDVQKTVTGAKPGDFRIHAGPEGYVYVLQIREVIPSEVRPLAEVRESIASTLYNEKFDRAVQEWFDKLRKAGSVREYLAKPDAK